ncbi:MAG: hypothetical protein Q7S43_03435 [bacterium]|nr:hypothetical protein [bacterium]
MARVNVEMVEKVAATIKNLSLEVRALDFTEEDKFPAVGDPGALDYFFAVTMHDYGFWIGDNRGYVEPLHGEIGGKRLKGSDLLWTLSMKVYRERGSEFFAPASLAKLEYHEFLEWLPESYHFQDLMTRHSMALNYGRYSRIGSRDLIHETNSQPRPLDFFLEATSLMPGYNKDRLFKKNLLLAMILANRPEKFLKVAPEEKWPPIVDYHLMRVALRLGLIELSLIEYDQLIRRVYVDYWTEAQIRKVTFDAIEMVIELSGKPMSEIDFLLWSARRYCPEMTKPDCSKCCFDDVCKKRVQLFQPVLRTTNY